MANTTELVKSNVQDIEKILSQSQDRIASVLPAHLKVDRMISVAMELVSGDSKLCQCEPVSILKGVMEASQLGLLLNKHLGHAYLVPFKSGALNAKYKREVYEANFLIGYRGLIDMVMRSNPQVASLYGRIVYTGEEFYLSEGTQHELIHRPSLTKRELKDYIGAYAVIIYKDTTPRDFEWMTKDEVEKVHKFSKAQSDSSPWATWPELMICKTPLRRLCKRLKLSPDMIEATVRDEYRELGYEGERPALRTIQMPRRMSEPAPAGEESQEQPTGEAEPPEQEPEAPTNGREEEPTIQLLKPEDRAQIFAEGKKAGFESKEAVLDFLFREFGCKETKDVTAAQYPTVIKAIQSRLTGDMSWKNPAPAAPAESSGKPEASKAAAAPTTDKKANKGKAKAEKEPAKEGAAPKEPKEGDTKQVIGKLEKTEACVNQKDQSKYLEITAANAPGVIIARNPPWMESLPKQIGKRLVFEIKLVGGAWEALDWWIAPA
jgi:recombination protein RecT